LSNDDAKRLIAQILKTGDVSFSNHALDEMANDGLTTVDAAESLSSARRCREPGDTGCEPRA